jgi:hypothetical protein
MKTKPHRDFVILKLIFILIVGYAIYSNFFKKTEVKMVDENWEKLRKQGYDVSPMTDEERRRIQSKSADALIH